MPPENLIDETSKGRQPNMFTERPLTNERVSFVNGLLSELEDQMHRYLDLVSEEKSLQAKITLCERNLQATRDFIESQLQNTDEDVPWNWEKQLSQVRFVAVRIGDACIEVLREASANGEDGLTTDEILQRLNDGQFRFRTGYPLREIHAALIRNGRVERDQDTWRIKLGSGARVA